MAAFAGTAGPFNFDRTKTRLEGARVVGGKVAEDLAADRAGRGRGIFDAFADFLTERVSGSASRAPVQTFDPPTLGGGHVRHNVPLATALDKRTVVIPVIVKSQLTVGSDYFELPTL